MDNLREYLTGYQNQVEGPAELTARLHAAFPDNVVFRGANRVEFTVPAALLPVVLANRDLAQIAQVH